MQWSLRQLIFIAVLLAVPLASFFLVFAPQNREINRAKEEIELKKTMLDKLREETAKSADLLVVNQTIRTAIDAIEARLPEGKDMDLVLRDVANIAGESGLKVAQFKRADKPLQAGEAMEQPMDVEITGGFDGFYQFLLQLEKLPRITRITDLKIKRNDQADGDMQATFKLSVYYQGALASAAQEERP